MLSLATVEGTNKTRYLILEYIHPLIYLSDKLDIGELVLV